MSQSRVVRLDHPPRRDFTDFIRVGPPVPAPPVRERVTITIPELGEPIPRSENECDWVYDDGGRAEAGFRGRTSDCVTRAIATGLHASGQLDLPRGDIYRTVYDELNEHCRIRDARARTKKSRTGSRVGVVPKVWRKYLADLGWTWTPTMGIGTGTRVHLRPGELPSGVILAQVSKHLVCVIDGVCHDTYDPGREGDRCVYGILTPPEVA